MPGVKPKVGPKKMRSAGMAKKPPGMRSGGAVKKMRSGGAVKKMAKGGAAVRSSSAKSL